MPPAGASRRAVRRPDIGDPVLPRSGSGNGGPVRASSVTAATGGVVPIPTVPRCGRSPGQPRHVCNNRVMPSEHGFHRLVGFSDAVVAIAITLLVLPLVESASSIGTTGLGTYLSDNSTKLWAFALSFAVIGSFWWGQHRVFVCVKAYNTVMVWAVFVWLFSIVFLPFPTELLGSARSGVGVHAIYVGTMVVAAGASLVQHLVVVRRPELQHDAARGRLTLDSAVVLLALMSFAFLVTVAVPSIGLWCLLVLLLSPPLEHWLAARRARHADGRLPAG